jgi:hypothetical protein
MFLENKYTKWYNAIIDNAKTQPRQKKKGIYYESHHIMPKSLGGIEEVLLTAKEHYICHLLLCKMFIGKNKYKMVNALIKMAFSKSKGQHRYTARSYDLVRKFIAEKNSAEFKGVPKSQKARNNMKGNSGTWKRTQEHKERMIGKNNPSYGKKGILNIANDPEIRKKISDKKKFYDLNPTKNIILGREKMRKNMKNKKWFTNGEKDVFSEVCPEGYYNGRSKNRKVK